jgi:hypothetical protein
MSAAREPLCVGAGAANQLADALTLLEQVLRRLRVALDGPDPAGAFAHAERLAVAVRVAAIIDAAIEVQGVAGEISTGVPPTSPVCDGDIVAAHDLLLLHARDASSSERAEPYERARRTLLDLWARGAKPYKGRARRLAERAALTLLR